MIDLRNQIVGEQVPCNGTRQTRAQSVSKTNIVTHNKDETTNKLYDTKLSEGSTEQNNKYNNCG